jgi:hypothetical protein
LSASTSLRSRGEVAVCRQGIREKENGGHGVNDAMAAVFIETSDCYQKWKNSRVLPLLMESEAELWIIVLTRFLHANRCPLRSKTL